LCKTKYSLNIFNIQQNKATLPKCGF